MTAEVGARHLGSRALVSILRRNFADRSDPPADCSLSTDGEILLDAALQHGVVPILCRTIARDDTAQTKMFAELREAARVQCAQSCALAVELANIFSVFPRNGIDALALKGPALSVLAYGDPGIRRSGDLDVLVRQQDVECASSLLTSLGYVEICEGAVPNKDRRYYRPSDGITFELHWRLHPIEMHVQVDERGVWKRAQTVSICNSNIRVPSTEDTLVYLSVHGRYHRWDRLKWVYDIAQLIQYSERIDPTLALNYATNVGCRRMLLVGVALASRLLGIEIPAPLAVAYNKDRLARLLVERASNDLLAQQHGADSTLLESIEYRERLRDRILFLRGKWRPNSADSAAFAMPAPLSFLYYFTRPVRLARVYGTGWISPTFFNRPGKQT